MNEHINKEGTFVPVTNIEYPENPNDFLLDPKIVKQVDIENNYPFLDNSFKHKLLNFLIYTGIFIIVFPIHKIKYGLKIKGRKNITKNKKLFKNGAMTVCNHVYKWDFLAVVQAVRYRRLWYPARPENVMTSDRNLVRGTGGIPIPSTLSGLRGFNQAFDTLHEKKKWIHLFPEACRWDFYQPIRPFKLGAFKMAYKYGIPVIPMVISYREPKGIFKLINKKGPLITLTVGEPIIPKKVDGMTKNEICNDMRKKAHETMVEMAGISQNKWQNNAD